MGNKQLRIKYVCRKSKRYLVQPKAVQCTGSLMATKGRPIYLFDLKAAYVLLIMILNTPNLTGFPPNISPVPCRNKVIVHGL